MSIVSNQLLSGPLDPEAIAAAASASLVTYPSNLLPVLEESLLVLASHDLPPAAWDCIINMCNKLIATAACETMVRCHANTLEVKGKAQNTGKSRVAGAGRVWTVEDVVNEKQHQKEVAEHEALEKVWKQKVKEDAALKKVEENQAKKVKAAEKALNAKAKQEADEVEKLRKAVVRVEKKAEKAVEAKKKKEAAEARKNAGPKQTQGRKGACHAKTPETPNRSVASLGPDNEDFENLPATDTSGPRDCSVPPTPVQRPVQQSCIPRAATPPPVSWVTQGAWKQPIVNEEVLPLPPKACLKPRLRTGPVKIYDE
jgi:hypothetical protein